MGMGLMILVGAAAVVAGEDDDSPGLQGLGVLLAGAAVLLAWRKLRRRDDG
jgi:MYXO-CTERM domain-containing protein